MWGWKSAERQISPSISIDEAREVLGQEGFNTHFSNPGHFVMKRPGTKLALSGRKFPIEISVSESEQGLFTRLRYDCFVWFDTGDLDRIADSLSEKLRRA